MSMIQARPTIEEKYIKRTTGELYEHTYQQTYSPTTFLQYTQLNYYDDENNNFTYHWGFNDIRSDNGLGHPIGTKCNCYDYVELTIYTEKDDEGNVNGYVDHFFIIDPSEADKYLNDSSINVRVQHNYVL
jgi:hypothetical protein